jgi:hypothetical protein
VRGSFSACGDFYGNLRKHRVMWERSSPQRTRDLAPQRTPRTLHGIPVPPGRRDQSQSKRTSRILDLIHAVGWGYWAC